MNNSSLYRLLTSLYLWKLKETTEQKKAVFDLIFSTMEENAALGWMLADSMQLDLEAELKLLYSNFIRSNSYYYVNKHESFKEAFEGFPGDYLSKIYSLSFYNIHRLSALIAYCHGLHHLVIRPSPHNEYGSWRWGAFLVGKGSLHELPPEIGHLKQLELFQVSRMALKYLPKEIGELNALKRVIITNTELKELPDSISQLKQLEVLVLTNNQIQKLPAHLIQLENLKVFEIKGNPLNVAEIPAILLNKEKAPKAIWKALNAELKL